jgi:hypothetical protein
MDGPALVEADLVPAYEVRIGHYLRRRRPVGGMDAVPDLWAARSGTEEGCMMLQWGDRITNYAVATGFPGSLFIAGDGRVVGTWIMGNDYRVKSKYYGGYPATYLRRMKALFPDKTRILHLFSGHVDQELIPGDTVDITPELNPTYVDDAQKLTRVPLEKYDLVMADPPYSEDDAERYGTTMVKRNTVLKALHRLTPGTHVVWLDQVLPMYRKDIFSIDAVIGMVKSTNHRFRVITIFRRLGPVPASERSPEHVDHRW